MQKLKNFVLIPTLLLTITACGDSATSSNDSGSAFGSPGATPFSGTWNINARLAVQAGSTTTNISQTSTVIVNSNGSTGIASTDTDCSVRINFNGSTINYQTTCLINNGVEGAAACTLTFTGFAAITGSSSNAAAGGSFNPQTLACNGAAVSYTGTIAGSN